MTDLQWGYSGLRMAGMTAPRQISDPERLMRIETLVEGLVTVVSKHTTALESHITAEEDDLRHIREQVGVAVALKPEVEALKKDVKDLNTMKNRALGWVAALIFAAGILWELIIHPITLFKDKT